MKCITTKIPPTTTHIGNGSNNKLFISVMNKRVPCSLALALFRPNPFSEDSVLSVCATLCTNVCCLFMCLGIQAENIIKLHGLHIMQSKLSTVSYAWLFDREVSIGRLTAFIYVRKHLLTLNTTRSSIIFTSTPVNVVHDFLYVYMFAYTFLRRHSYLVIMCFTCQNSEMSTRHSESNRKAPFTA